jgi:hypothetical protein
MAQLPDATCLIKVLATDGTLVPDGGTVFMSDPATIRYVIFNDSDLPMGPMTVAGRLFRNGLRVRPDPVPIQGFTLQPNQVWTSEYVVFESFGPNGASYQATLATDIGNFVNEEDESNNSATRSFSTVQF